MSEFLMVRPDQAVSVRWTRPSGQAAVSAGRLETVSYRSRSLWIKRGAATAELPPLDQPVRVEVSLTEGLGVIVGRVQLARPGRVLVVAERAFEYVQRRRYRRSPVHDPFATAILLDAAGQPSRSFLVRLEDVSGGGVRFRHDVELRPGDRVRLELRFDADRPLTPIVTILESTRRGDGAAPAALACARGFFSAIDPMERAGIMLYVLREQARPRTWGARLARSQMSRRRAG